MVAIEVTCVENRGINLLAGDIVFRSLFLFCIILTVILSGLESLHTRELSKCESSSHKNIGIEKAVHSDTKEKHADQHESCGYDHQLSLKSAPLIILYAPTFYHLPILSPPKLNLQTFQFLPIKPPSLLA